LIVAGYCCAYILAVDSHCGQQGRRHVFGHVSGGSEFDTVEPVYFAADVYCQFVVGAVGRNIGALNAYIVDAVAVGINGISDELYAEGQRGAYFSVYREPADCGIFNVGTPARFYVGVYNLRAFAERQRRYKFVSALHDANRCADGQVFNRFVVDFRLYERDVEACGQAVAFEYVGQRGKWHLSCRLEVFGSVEGTQGREAVVALSGIAYDEITRLVERVRACVGLVAFFIGEYRYD